jgi:hypothetical protein
MSSTIGQSPPSRLLVGNPDVGTKPVFPTPPTGVDGDPRGRRSHSSIRNQPRPPPTHKQRSQSSTREPNSSTLVLMVLDPQTENFRRVSGKDLAKPEFLQAVLSYLVNAGNRAGSQPESGGFGGLGGGLPIY